MPGLSPAWPLMMAQASCPFPWPGFPTSVKWGIQNRALSFICIHSSRLNTEISRQKFLQIRLWKNFKYETGVKMLMLLRCQSLDREGVLMGQCNTSVYQLKKAIGSPAHLVPEELCKLLGKQSRWFRVTRKNVVMRWGGKVAYFLAINSSCIRTHYLIMSIIST